MSARGSGCNRRSRTLAARAGARPAAVPEEAQPSTPSVAVRMAGVTRALQRNRRRGGARPRDPGRRGRRRDRAVRLGQDDHDPDDHRLARPDLRHARGARRAARRASAAGRASGSATCPSCSACTRTSPCGENVDFAASLYGLAVLAALAAPARRAPAARPVGRPPSSRGPAVRRHEAPPRARRGARPRAATCSSSTSRPRASTRCCGARSGTRSTASAIEASPRWSPRSTSPRPRSATASRSSRKGA